MHTFRTGFALCPALKAPLPSPALSSFPPAFHLQMPIWDHLEELRERVLVAGLACAASIFTCFCFSKELIVFLEAPVADAGVRFLQLSPGEFFFTTLKVWRGLRADIAGVWGGRRWQTQGCASCSCRQGSSSFPRSRCGGGSIGVFSEEHSWGMQGCASCSSSTPRSRCGEDRGQGSWGCGEAAGGRCGGAPLAAVARGILLHHAQGVGCLDRRKCGECGEATGGRCEDAAVARGVLLHHALRGQGMYCEGAAGESTRGVLISGWVEKLLHGTFSYAPSPFATHQSPMAPLTFRYSSITHGPPHLSLLINHLWPPSPVLPLPCPSPLPSPDLPLLTGSSSRTRFLPLRLSISSCHTPTALSSHCGPSTSTLSLCWCSCSAQGCRSR